jgi:hypothetical protein
VSDHGGDMSEPVRTLTEDELRALTGRLAATTLSGVAATGGDPFQPGLAVVVEDSATGLERLRAGLARLTAAGAPPRWYALRYESDREHRLRWLDGVAIEVAADDPRFAELGQDVGFLINGLDFVLTDDTGAWAVMTTTDVVLVGGPADRVRSYFDGDATERDRARPDRGRRGRAASTESRGHLPRARANARASRSTSRWSATRWRVVMVPSAAVAKMSIVGPLPAS